MSNRLNSFLPQQTLSYIIKAIILVVVFGSVFLNNNNTVMAQNDAVMTVEILDLPVYLPDTLAVGEQMTFRIRYSCGAVIGGNCDTFSISVALPDWFDTSSAILDAGAPYAIFATATGGGLLTLTLLDNDATAANAFRLDPGESETATVTIRVRDDAYDFSSNTPPAVDVEIITVASTSNANSQTDPPPTTIGLEVPDIQWSMDKVRILPPLSVTPAVDQPVVYRLCLSSDSNIDNYILNDFSITDTIPDGAEVLSPASSPPSITYITNDDGSPDVDRVIWDFTGQTLSFRNGSICRNLTLRYPSSAGYTTASNVTNIADSTLVTISGETCVTNCTGNDTEPHGFGVEVATPSTSKTIAQNPVGLTGIGRWQLSLNTRLSNAPTDLLEFIDEMPFDDDNVDPGPVTSDYLPLEIFQIITGLWSPVSVGDASIDVRATIETSETTTCQTAPGGATWSTLAGSPFDGSSQVSVPLITPNNIRCVRTTFEQNDGNGWVPGAPMNFQVGSDFEILFEVRDQTGEGLEYIGVLAPPLQNCMYTSSSVDGGPNDAVISSATNCADVEISGSIDNVSVNFRKTMPSNPEPEENITISLIIDLTERASVDLISPIIADAIPDNILINQASDFWNISYTGDFTSDTILTEADIRAGVGGSGFSVTTQNIDHDNNAGTPDESREVITFDLSSLSVAPPPLGNKTIRIDIFAQIRPFTASTEPPPVPSYTNVAYFIESGPGDLVCEQSAGSGSNGTVVDVDDVFGISATDICRISRNYEVPSTARFAGQKWLRNEDDPTNIVLAPGLSGVCEDATVVTDGQVTESNYTRNPCVHEGDVGDTFTYRLTVQNTGNISLFDYHLYDLLPYEGDTGVSLVGSSRDSNWRPIMTSNGVAYSDSDLMTGAPVGNSTLGAGNFLIEYSDSRIPCRLEVGITSACDTVTWSTNPAVDFANGWSSVESFRIILNPGVAWEPGVRVEFLVEMEIPTIDFYDTFTFAPIAGTTNPAAGTDTTQNPEVDNVAWNNYAHNFYETNNIPVVPGDLLAVAEPPRVGILIPEFGSIGNIVFFDADNDRLYEPLAGELPISGVTVQLYADTNGSGGFNTGDLLVSTTTTGNPQITDAGLNPGYYLFDNLAEGDYFVHLPASNFAGGGALNLYESSTDTATVVDSFNNNLDHGVDDANAITNGITSPLININYENEPTTDDGVGNVSSDTNDGPNFRGNQHEENNSSDLTVDFGFFRPMSIGNRVWLDVDRATGVLGDGIRQATELGIGGVTVQLYTDNGSGGLGTFVAETITTGVGTGANNGYYMFDRVGNDQTSLTASRIESGDYIVHIPPSQFATSAVLDGFVNSNGVAGSGGDTQTDSITGGGDENGVNATPGTASTYPATAGVSSGVIQLRYDTEPVIATEPDRDPLRVTNINGLNVEDDNSDLTIDFGFYQGLAIGNRVWFDTNRDGFIDINDDNPNVGGTNPAIPDVTVYLYRDTDNNGVPDGAFIATDVTNANGYYLFDQTGDQTVAGGGQLLAPGNYIVGIDPTAGSNSTALANMVNTITRADSNGNTNVTPTDSPTDNDDNGIDRRDLGSVPAIIYSETIVLSHFDETTTELAGDKEAVIGDGRYGIQDENSNLTVDFGYYMPMSIGNQVWFDTNNDALIDGVEVGINGVIVELFRDTGSGIDPLNDTPYRTTTTVTGGINGEGYYIFDDLPQGNYIVRLAPSNFNTGGALVDGTGAPYSSSESGGATEAVYLIDNQTDNNDNGIDTNFPQIDGIVSNVINLSYNAEPDGATDDTPNLNPVVGEGTFGERDDNAEMTVDFGVYSPLMSIGNRVFKDYDNDRIFNGVDVGVDGVVVNLFMDSDQNGVPDSGITNPIATTTTAGDGWYLFDGLSAGFYLVQVDEDNFRTGGNGTLRDFYSSQDKASPTATTQTLPVEENDTLENGIDNPFDPAMNPDLQAQGVFSQTINLEPSGELTNEDVTGGLGPDGDGEPNIEQSNSDLSVDFGFYQPMSIGNFVWFDTSEDGLFNGVEAGIAGVQVELYRDDGNGVFDGGDTLVPVFNGTGYDLFDITDANGFYLFDNLLPGQYFVHIPSTDFASGNTLFNHISTIPNNVANPSIAPAPSSDSNDNGTPDDTTNTTLGVTSELVTLGVGGIPNGSEPTNEIHKSNNPPSDPATYDGPASIGRYGELDNNSNITIDFGFILADDSSMSIGNRVWFDTNHNGLIDNAGDDNPVAPGNPGIDNVVVLLYRADLSGNPIGNPIARDITANGGYYLFDVMDTDVLTAIGDGDGLGGSIAPGNYIVALPNSNFAGGGPLENYASTNTNIDNDGTLPPSTGVESGYGVIDDDNNDNGTANITYGVLSNLVTLTLVSERDDEDVTNKEVGVLDGTDTSANPIAFNNSDLTIDFGFYLPMSIGNFVWIDANNDGLYDDTAEVPVDDGVVLALYQSDGTTPVDDPANPGTPYQVTTAGGFYLFEGLPPGTYIVRVDLANFLPTGLLEGYTGSDNGGTFEDDTDDDLNDNGRDVTPTTNGIPSGVITLAYNTEPITEATSGNLADGPNGRGNNGELDDNSNLTVDFGVFPTTYFSIGNRIWVDMGAGANENNGIHDSDELGIESVIVNLFRDENDGAGGAPDGIPDSTIPFATTTTDIDGYYLFDSLASGNYIVSVSPDNFDAGGALRGYSPAPEPPADTTESVTDHASDQISNTIDPDFGFYSATYTLELTPAEPINEADATPANAVQDPGLDPFGNAIPDLNSNLTVDFGFVRTLTLGNLVWFDIDNDGNYDNSTEVGIAGVTVELYLDDGASPGTFDGTNTLIDTEVTDGNGFYLFENLDPDDYFVHIPNNLNWTGGSTPLAGFESSAPDASSPDTNDDNDNGLGTGDTNPSPGVTSELLTLDFGAAPTGESTLSNNPADGPEYRGVNNPPDNNSDLTWDFGFFLGDPMSIGNIVWIDDGNTTGTGNNGVRDGDELGVDGVIVELYADSDGDGNPDTSSPIGTETTANEGYYLFDGLPPGQYVVVISEDNFDGGILDGYLSTTDGTTPDNDDNDNGIDNPTPSTGGISSATIVLEVGTEPSPTNTPDDSEDVTGSGSNGETDDNSNLTVDFGFIPAYDWGDAPDSYGTDIDILTPASPTGDSQTVGPSHRIIANLYLGTFVDDEADGVPVADGTSNNATDSDGDGADGGFDEEGLDIPDFVAGTTVTVDITAFNDTGTDATLVAWFDWDGNGVFDDSEGNLVTVPDGTDGIVQIDVTIPDDAEDLTGGNTYARLRLTTDTITISEPTGPKNSGEVEDYYVAVRDPGLLINKTDGLNSIVAGTFNTYTIVIENSGDPRTGVRFFDDIPLATPTDANGYDPETITWTCVAENGASCIANAVSGTGSSGGPYAADATSVIIDELIDLPRDGRITYSVTAQVNEDAGLIPLGNTNPIVNVAQLPNEILPMEDEDETSVIFDPPYGIKTGTYLGNNIIRWTMTWYNPGATQTNVTVNDELASNQEFPATTAAINLQCSGSIGTCSIIGDDIVQWVGTMLTSTPNNDADAVVISFNVLVSGDGRYINNATLNYSDEEATVRDRVTIKGDEEDESDPDDGGFTQSAPSLIKTVDTPFTLPGATVVWTITAVNDTNQTITNVSITDDVPAQLTITDGSSSSGNLTINGQTVEVKQNSFAPGETITITLTTDVDTDVAIPFAINNPAVLRCDCTNESNAIATIISVLELPATGQTPWWRIPLMLFMMMGSLIGVIVPVIVYHRKTKHIS